MHAFTANDNVRSSGEQDLRANSGEYLVQQCRQLLTNELHDLNNGCGRTIHLQIGEKLFIGTMS